MDDKLNLKQYIRTVDDFPIPGIKFRDITSLIENPEGLIKSCKAFTKLTKEFGATIIASIESRGFIFAGPISKDLSLPFVLARKPGKLPNKTYKKDFNMFVLKEQHLKIKRNKNKKIIENFTKKEKIFRSKLGNNFIYSYNLKKFYEINMKLFKKDIFCWFGKKLI